VRHKTSSEPISSSTAMIVSSDTSVVSPPSTPARSDSSHQCFSSSDCSQSEIPGSVTFGTSRTGGDCFCPPPGASEKYSFDRNNANPGASRLIATPEMMWSTPKVTVATACSSPASAPRISPNAAPAHGPHW
jgi:hypothetical protein